MRIPPTSSWARATRGQRALLLVVAVISIGGGLVSAVVVRDAALAGIFFSLGAVVFGSMGLFVRSRHR